MINLKQSTPLCPFGSGALELFDQIIDEQQCYVMSEKLLNETHWNRGEYNVAGRKFTMPREQSWYADPGIVYNFSIPLHQHRLWTPVLTRLKHQIEMICNNPFNSVLINWYRNGLDWVDWHCDNEIELGEKPFIASLSFGASRRFCYRHKVTQEFGEIILKNGSLLIMKPIFQQEWLHCIPREKQLKQPRINLTFRNVMMPCNNPNK